MAFWQKTNTLRFMRGFVLHRREEEREGLKGRKMEEGQLQEKSHIEVAFFPGSSHLKNF